MDSLNISEIPVENENSSSTRRVAGFAPSSASASHNRQAGYQLPNSESIVHANPRLKRGGSLTDVEADNSSNQKQSIGGGEEVRRSRAPIFGSYSRKQSPVIKTTGIEAKSIADDSFYTCLDHSKIEFLSYGGGDTSKLAEFPQQPIRSVPLSTQSDAVKTAELSRATREAKAEMLSYAQNFFDLLKRDIQSNHMNIQEIRHHVPQSASVISSKVETIEQSDTQLRQQVASLQELVLEQRRALDLKQSIRENLSEESNSRTEKVQRELDNLIRQKVEALNIRCKHIESLTNDASTTAAATSHHDRLNEINRTAAHKAQLAESKLKSLESTIETCKHGLHTKVNIAEIRGYFNEIVESRARKISAQLLRIQSAWESTQTNPLQVAQQEESQRVREKEMREKIESIEQKCASSSFNSTGPVASLASETRIVQLKEDILMLKSSFSTVLENVKRLEATTASSVAQQSSQVLNDKLRSIEEKIKILQKTLVNVEQGTSSSQIAELSTTVQSLVRNLHAIDQYKEKKLEMLEKKLNATKEQTDVRIAQLFKSLGKQGNDEKQSSFKVRLSSPFSSSGGRGNNLLAQSPLVNNRNSQLGQGSRLTTTTTPKTNQLLQSADSLQEHFSSAASSFSQENLQQSTDQLAWWEQLRSEELAHEQLEKQLGTQKYKEVILSGKLLNESPLTQTGQPRPDFSKKKDNSQLQQQQMKDQHQQQQQQKQLQQQQNNNQQQMQGQQQKHYNHPQQLKQQQHPPNNHNAQLITFRNDQGYQQLQQHQQQHLTQIRSSDQMNFPRERSSSSSSSHMQGDFDQESSSMFGTPMGGGSLNDSCNPSDPQPPQQWGEQPQINNQHHGVDARGVSRIDHQQDKESSRDLEDLLNEFEDFSEEGGYQRINQRGGFGGSLRQELNQIIEVEERSEDESRVSSSNTSKLSSQLQRQSQYEKSRSSSERSSSQNQIPTAPTFTSNISSDQPHPHLSERSSFIDNKIFVQVTGYLDAKQLTKLRCKVDHIGYLKDTNGFFIFDSDNRMIKTDPTTLALLQDQGLLQVL